MNNFASRTIVSINRSLNIQIMWKTYFCELVSGFLLNLDQTTAVYLWTL